MARGCGKGLSVSFGTLVVSLHSEKVHLSMVNKEDTEEGKFSRHLFGMSLLDASMVSPYFISETVSTAPNDKRFIELLD